MFTRRGSKASGRTWLPSTCPCRAEAERRRGSWPGLPFLAPPSPCMASFLSAPTLLPHLCNPRPLLLLTSALVRFQPLPCFPLSILHSMILEALSRPRLEPWWAACQPSLMPPLPARLLVKAPHHWGCHTPPQSPLSLPSQGLLPHTLLWGAPQPPLVPGRVTTGQRPQVHLCAVFYPVAPQLLTLIPQHRTPQAQGRIMQSEVTAQ